MKIIYRNKFFSCAIGLFSAMLINVSGAIAGEVRADTITRTHFFDGAVSRLTMDFFSSSISGGIVFQNTVGLSPVITGNGTVTHTVTDTSLAGIASDRVAGSFQFPNNGNLGARFGTLSIDDFMISRTDTGAGGGTILLGSGSALEVTWDNAAAASIGGTYFGLLSLENSHEAGSLTVTNGSNFSIIPHLGSGFTSGTVTLVNGLMRPSYTASAVRNITVTDTAMMNYSIATADDGDLKLIIEPKTTGAMAMPPRHTPIPSALWLLGAGLTCFGLLRRKKAGAGLLSEA